MTTITKKLLAIVLFLNLIITTLHSDIISQLSNKSLTISGYFFSSNKSSYFLRYMNESNSSLWLYTKQRKFKPIHNTKAYDGYDKANMLFKNIMVDANHSITISSVINIDSPHKDISNKTFTPTHLLLKDNNTNNNSNYNVLSNKNATSLWEYKNRKYRPIHNAKAFDGYEEAKKIFDDINITKDNNIRIGDIDTVNYTSFKTKEYSLNNTKAIKIIKSSNYKDNFMRLTDNLIIDKANELIWQDNNDNTLRTYGEAKDYCENLKIDGHSGFRLPNRLEGISIFNEEGLHNEVFNIPHKLSLLKKLPFNPLNLPTLPDGSYPGSEYRRPSKSLHWLLDFNTFVISEYNNTYSFGLNDTYAVNTHSFGLNDIYSISRTDVMIPEKSLVKCVNGKQLSLPIFIRDNINETVKDVSNNVIWQDNINIRQKIKLNKIKEYCNKLNLTNSDTWRKPTDTEYNILALSNNAKTKKNILNGYFKNYKRYTTYISNELSQETTKEIISFTDDLLRGDDLNLYTMFNVNVEYNIFGNKFDTHSKTYLYVNNYFSQKAKNEISMLKHFKGRKRSIVDRHNMFWENDLKVFKNKYEITLNDYKLYLAKKEIFYSPGDERIFNATNKRRFMFTKENSQNTFHYTFTVSDDLKKLMKEDGYSFFNLINKNKYEETKIKYEKDAIFATSEHRLLGETILKLIASYNINPHLFITAYNGNNKSFRMMCIKDD